MSIYDGAMNVDAEFYDLRVKLNQFRVSD